MDLEISYSLGPTNFEFCSPYKKIGEVLFLVLGSGDYCCWAKEPAG